MPLRIGQLVPRWLVPAKLPVELRQLHACRHKPQILHPSETFVTEYVIASLIAAAATCYGVGGCL